MLKLLLQEIAKKPFFAGYNYITPKSNYKLTEKPSSPKKIKVYQQGNIMSATNV